jgi:hypothetical protein
MKLNTYGPYINQELTTASNLNVAGPIENMNIVASAVPATINMDVTTSTFWYYTATASANFTLNLRGNANSTFNALLAPGQSVSLVLMITNGTTAYYLSALTIDGVSVIPKWLSAVSPASGNVSGVDAYSITVIKTANATFTAIATGPSKFA